MASALGESYRRPESRGARYRAYLSTRHKAIPASDRPLIVPSYRLSFRQRRCRLSETRPTPPVLTYSGRQAKGDAMTSADTAAAAPPSYRWARVGLVLIAAIELLDAVSSLSIITRPRCCVMRKDSTASSSRCHPCSLARHWSSLHEEIFATRFLPWPHSHLPAGCLTVCRRL